MAKKIRFPLEMENGAEVRSLSELKENFSLTQALLYLENGKLIAWLRDRYEDEIADALEKLELSDKELPRKVSEIFGVPYDDETERNMERALKRKRKLNLFTEYNIDSKYKQNVDNIAYDQDDLYDLLDSGAETVYLYGEKFYIPLGKSNVSYIGINEPVVVISSEKVVDFSAKGITFENCVFNEKYAQLVANDEKVKAQNEKVEAIKAEVKAFADKMITEIDGVIDEIVDYDNDDYFGLNSLFKALDLKSTSDDNEYEGVWLEYRVRSKAEKYYDRIENRFFERLHYLWTTYDAYVKCIKPFFEVAANYLSERKDKIMENYSDTMKEPIYSDPVLRSYYHQEIMESRNKIINVNDIRNKQVEELLKYDGSVSEIWKDFSSKAMALHKKEMIEYLEQLKNKIRALY